jgi:PAS domain S-box-containing protein
MLNSSPIGAVASCHSAQEALDYSESRYRTLVEHSPVGIWQTTPQGETLYLNRAMCDLFEIDSPAEMAGKTYRDFYTPESIEVVQREHARRRRGEASSYEVEIVGARGSHRNVMIYGAPILDGENRISSFIATIVDVTAERESRRLIDAAQEQVRRLNAELEARVARRTRELLASNAQMEAFCYTVSHDLKAPLRAICSFSEILEEDLSSTLSPGCLEGLRAISKSARRMDQLLHDLLEFTRISRCELQLQTIDPSALLEKLIRTLPRDVEAATKVERPFPSVLGHETALEQIFTNLLTNAHKFRRPEVPPVVRVFGQRFGARVRVYVEDNGIGIAPEHRERIFGVFERLHPHHEYPGTGVGLAIVKCYTEKMGGAVGLESNVGSGSRFWIELASEGTSLNG